MLHFFSSYRRVSLRPDESSARRHSIERKVNSTKVVNKLLITIAFDFGRSRLINNCCSGTRGCGRAAIGMRSIRH